MKRFRGDRAERIDVMPDEIWHPTELYEVAPEIIRALDGCQVWGQSVQFDVWKLRHWLDVYEVDYPPRMAVPCFNIETLAAEHLPFLRRFSLTSLAKALGIDTKGAHTARVDANLARLIYEALHRSTPLNRWLIELNYSKNNPDA